MNANLKGYSRRWLGTPLIIVLIIVLLPGVVAAALLWLIIDFVAKLLLLITVWTVWSPRGIDTLLVYSKSPHWMGYFESGLIPRLKHRSRVLNWSERANWPSCDLRVRAFRAFKGPHSFNPMVLVFRPFRWPRTFRFYEAFKQHKHGQEQPSHDLEGQLIACLQGRETDRPMRST